MRKIYSDWQSASWYSKTLSRQRSMLWLVFCHYRSPLSRLERFHQLRIRIAWNVLLPSYGAERVTWWHVLGIRKFSTIVPHEIVGIHVDGNMYRYWWYVA